jgi:hypothetical protein
MFVVVVQVVEEKAMKANHTRTMKTNHRGKTMRTPHSEFVMFVVVVVVSNTRTQTRHRHMVLEIHILVWDMYSEWVNGMWSLIQIRIIKKHYAVSMNTCTASILKNSNDENLHDKCWI